LQHLLSQLAHVELLTPKPAETVDFFHKLMGFEITEQTGQSAYMRGWGEFFHHTVKITEAPDAGLGHAAWRAESPEDLAAAVVLLEEGAGDGWIDGDRGHGPAYRFRSPGGHVGEVFWEVDWYEAPAELRSKMPSRPQKYTGRGLAARRIDHVTIASGNVTADRLFFEKLGFKTNEGLVNEQMEFGAWMSLTSLSHDLGILGDSNPGGVGRLAHLALWCDSREEVMRAADLLKDADVHIEHHPSKHGISEAFSLYCYEPGGNRIEIYSGTYLNFTPDWGPINWDFDTIREAAFAWWGGEVPMSQMTYFTPDLTKNES
jgi:catechol 2,3-dioxygenase